MSVTVKFSLYIMGLMIKMNHEQYDKVTGAVDFRGRRPGKDGMPVEGVYFDNILALLPLKMFIFLQRIPAKQGFHSSTSLKFSRDARAEAISRQKEIFWYKLFCHCKGLLFAANFAMYMMKACIFGLSLFIMAV